MLEFEKLLLYNKSWVQDKLELDSQYFSALAADQKPNFLWIGCSDSRVSAEQITGTDPGEMFVHRNIANLVVPGDLNVLSVVQYAVEVLQVRHVVVCGHYECGGVKAAMAGKPLGLIDQWLVNIDHVQQEHKAELTQIEDTHARFDRLVELNVKQQILNLAETESVRKMWASHQMPTLHGWVFNLRTGLLNEVIHREPAGQSGGPANSLKQAQPIAKTVH
ncbi:carbonic anhydrase [Spirosoma utsteinense]|uniref:Carbonic anhydrase n=1 Tax=Spirosoma utsteinense TaxID=2585773 RepID=A0ABR6W9H8_9BACT|nr:carbonic anhydrase [Spirosoma utsteinense]MBC3787639.1 carbonic anhydrase [Spirosoma utsteinense]MBC3793235.1 carbonic anhydrase [Spirosoma utsteinense]